MIEFLESNYFLGNSYRNIAICLAVFLILFIIKSFIRKFLAFLLLNIFKQKKSKEVVLKFNDLVKKPMHIFLFLLAIYIAKHFIYIPNFEYVSDSFQFSFIKTIKSLYFIAISIVATWLTIRIITFIGFLFLEEAKKTETQSDDQIVTFAFDAIKIITYIIAFILILKFVLHFNVSSLIASVGIGGLALALAAKESLENLLGSFTIFMDKPFIQGDLIIVEGVTGSVEYIGLRSTRIRTLEKSYVTVPNKVMVNAKLDNLTERTLRRVDFTIGVIYATKKEQIENIVTDITSYLNSLTFVDENPAVRFSEFGESSLNIRILFFLKSIDWQLYMDTRQDINFNIMEIVEKHGSDFACPSRTVYLQQN